MNKYILSLCIFINACQITGKSSSDLLNYKGLWVNKEEPNKATFIDGDDFKTGRYIKIKHQGTLFDREIYGGQLVDAKIDKEGDLIYLDDLGSQRWRWHLNEQNDTLNCTVTGNDASYTKTLRYYKYNK